MDSATANSSRSVPKRHHNKSRLGCAACKARRVKCDEQHPKCTNCARRGEACEYVTPGPIYKKRRNTKSAAESSDSGFNVEQHNDTFNLGTELSSNSPPTPSTAHVIPYGTNFPLITMDDSYGWFNSSKTQSGCTDYGFDSDLLSSSTADPPDGDSNDSKALVKEDFSKYMQHTIVNSQLFAYYQTSYHFRISTNLPAVRAWSAISGIAHIYPYMYHMMMAVMLASLYYDAIEAAEADEKEQVLQLDNPQQYMLLANMHHRQFIEKFDIVSSTRSQNLIELFSYMSCSAMHLLYYALDPNTSMTDRAYFEVGRTGLMLYKDLMPFSFNEESDNEDDLPLDTSREKPPGDVRVRKGLVHEATCMELEYYAPHVVPKIDQCPWLFFPHHLYQLLDYMEFEGTPQSVFCGHKNVLKKAIDTLKREYNLVYNTVSPEPDSLRVLIRWPALLHNIFLDALDNREPRALIVVAHYVMLLASLDFDKLMPWPMFKREIVLIDRTLDDTWRPWISQPKLMFGLP